MRGPAPEAALPMPTPLDQATLKRVRDIFAEITPWSGEVPVGRTRNFLGTLELSTAKSEGTATESFESRRLGPADGEPFFELVSAYWSILAARGRYTAVSLGAHYGAPLVNAVYLLKAARPMAFRLIGVESDQHMCTLFYAYLAENGIPPTDHCVINAVVGGDNTPVLFPVSEVPSGANYALNDRGQRTRIYEGIVEDGRAEEVLRNVMLDMTLATNAYIPLNETDIVTADLEVVSTVTVSDVVSPHDVVDFLEIDIQWAEIGALPPAMEVLNRKVRWIHLGTHGPQSHEAMRDMFGGQGWDIRINLTPMTEYIVPGGTFSTMDGILSLRNPRLAADL